ncbi:SdpI family protein [Portibacter lacus]|uniref:SdpI family protein n=1 Tax=Portibacter lacus TaxID=1099794 RepID=A0AA37SR50_9BACT|nr:SdpI family protein [Portibacter lacus]GLR18497.1 hypothetical protein GCM10007940_31130 [Portibacter lacus]
MTTLDLGIFNNVIFICLFSSGIIIWLIGIYVLRKPPESINKLYGFRTPNAMKSQEAWDYAQVHGTKRMVRAAQLMILLSFISLYFNFSEMVGSLIAIAVLLIVLITPLVITEKELKEKFG